MASHSDGDAKETMKEAAVSNVAEDSGAKVGNVDAAEAASVSSQEELMTKQLSTKRALWSWLLLCYSTGPTFSVSATYIPAALQSLTNVLGHKPGSNERCALRGDIECVVRFGSGEINYNSYVLYLNAISRACDGVCTILVSGLADFSHYRKSLMIISIVIFGALALPLAGLEDRTFGNLKAISVLYATMSAINGVYGTMESSYIPQFMRAAGLQFTRHKLDDEPQQQQGIQAEEETDKDKADKHMWNRGSRVSVFGLFAGNLGSITALLIGIVISYSRGRPETEGYGNFLIAITVAGCMTVVLGLTGGILIPSIKGKPKPPGNLLFITLGRWVKLLKCIPKYPEAFKFVVGWILWNTAYSNFNTIIQLLFRETYGLGRSDALFTVYICTAIIFASIGSLTWTFVFPHLKVSIKLWAFVFLGINMFCIFWGCLGINGSVPIGYKHGAEFWVEQVIFLGTSSALRATNRVIYSSMIPVGHEAQFFGLELALDLATGWIGPLVTGSIQNSANNLRVPMVINFALMAITVALYWWTDIEKGRRDAKTPMYDDEVTT